jgi:hypothetical protein
MKSILLTTTAIVAFAGAAAADGHAGVSFGGDASVGYNDNSAGSNDGFYWEADLDVDLSATLDNGVTAGASFEFDIVDETNGQATVSDSYVLSLTTENAGLYVGDTAFAAETRWSGAGDMEADNFSAQDGENVIRGDVTVGGVEASISYAITDAGGQMTDIAGGTNVYTDEVDQLSVGVNGTFGMFTVGVAYQEESIAVASGVADGDPADYDPTDENGDFNLGEVFGISVGASVGGADITVAYASRETTDENSTGIQVAYPFGGGITGTVYYVSEDDADSDEDNYGVTVAYAPENGPIAVTLDYDYDQGVNKTALDGSYDVGNGVTILAGLYNESDSADEGTDAYIAATYDLGGGAELLVSYADADRTGTLGDDEVGGPEYQVGTTVELSFAF